MYLVFVRIPGTELLNPFLLNYENPKCVFCYVNGVTFRKPLGNQRMKDWFQGNQPCD